MSFKSGKVFHHLKVVPIAHLLNLYQLSNARLQLGVNILQSTTHLYVRTLNINTKILMYWSTEVLKYWNFSNAWLQLRVVCFPPTPIVYMMLKSLHCSWSTSRVCLYVPNAVHFSQHYYWKSFNWSLKSITYSMDGSTQCKQISAHWAADCFCQKLARLLPPCSNPSSVYILFTICCLQLNFYYLLFLSLGGMAKMAPPSFHLSRLYFLCTVYYSLFTFYH